VVLDGQGSIKEGLSLDAKLVLDAGQGATLVRDALEVIFLNTLGQVGEGLLARESDSAAEHVNENPDHVLDTINRGITTSRNVSKADIIGLGELSQDNSPGGQDQIGKSHRALLTKPEKFREALKVHHNSLELPLEAIVSRVSNMAGTHSTKVMLPVSKGFALVLGTNEIDVVAEQGT
jgi:hypothetical protein